MRLLIIGFDGLDYYLARDFLKKNPKPFFLEKLKSKIPITGPAWASIYTGVNCETHGITDPWGRPTKGSRCFESIKRFAFWEILKRNGFSVFVDNLPITKTGLPFSMDEKKDCAFWWSKEKATIQKYLGLIRKMGFERAFDRVKRNNSALIEGYLKQDADLMFVQFSFVDRLFHSLGASEMDLRAVYAHCFEIVEKLYGLLKPENLLVVSDHGFQPKPNKNVPPEHSYAIDGCCIFNKKTRDFLNAGGFLGSSSWLRCSLYDFLFSRYGQKRAFLAVNLHRVGRALTEGKVFEIFEYFSSRIEAIARGKKWEGTKDKAAKKYFKKLVRDFAAAKHDFSYGLPQTKLFGAILEMFGIRKFPDIRTAKIIGERTRIGKAELKLTTERLHALGYD